MKNITYIFFDLDHTLWDHAANADSVLKDAFEHFDLKNKIDSSKSDFLQSYHEVNNQLWDDYNHGRIEREYLREERFKLVLENCGTDSIDVARDISEYFLYHCPRQKGIIDGADVILNYLHPKYPMSIITNGFDDIQAVKLNSSGLAKYFQHVFTSESSGGRKPDPIIFHHALKTVGVKPEQAVMIGDNPKADIEGALNAGITPVFFDPTGKFKSVCELQIGHLSELMKLL